jgi:arabinogalactan oligomer/maltooligosaccharide transport system substrate-binding protein
MKKGKWIALSMATIAATGMAACGKTMEGEIKLTVWVSEADQPFAKEVAEKFQKANSGKQYRFVFDVQGENEMATRVLNDVESAADVFSFPNDQLTQLVNGDALTRIGGSRLETLKAQNTADSVDAATVKRGNNEEVYGIPYTDNTFFMYYDQSVLTEQDVASMDGILAKCNGNKKLGFMVSDGWYNSAFYFGKGLGYEVTYDNSLGEKTITCDFNNEVGQEVTQSLWSLVKDSRVKADADDSKIVAGIADGSIIAAFSGVWNRKAIEEALGENFAAAKLPTYTFGGEEQTQLVAFAGYKLMGVNNYSANKAEAIAFADYYTNAENQIRHFEMRSYLPTNVDARADERVKKDVVAAAIAEQLKYSKTQKNVPSTLWNPLKGLGNAMLTAIQTGDFALKSQLDACVAAIEKK